MSKINFISSLLLKFCITLNIYSNKYFNKNLFMFLSKLTTSLLNIFFFSRHILVRLFYFGNLVFRRLKYIGWWAWYVCYTLFEELKTKKIAEMESRHSQFQHLCNKAHTFSLNYLRSIFHSWKERPGDMQLNSETDSINKMKTRNRNTEPRTNSYRHFIPFLVRKTFLFSFSCAVLTNK